LSRPLVVEIRAQLCQQLGEIVSGLMEIAAQRAHGVEVAARGAAQTKIDSSRKEGGQCTELLGDNEWRVVG
jgi:hypothetical protein